MACTCTSPQLQSTVCKYVNAAVTSCHGELFARLRFTTKNCQIELPDEAAILRNMPNRAKGKTLHGSLIIASRELLHARLGGQEVLQCVWGDVHVSGSHLEFMVGVKFRSLDSKWQALNLWVSTNIQQCPREMASQSMRRKSQDRISRLFLAGSRPVLLHDLHLCNDSHPLTDHWHSCLSFLHCESGRARQ